MSMEDSNTFSPYTVAIRKSANIIGYVPGKISAACSLFVQKGGTLTCIANYQFSPQGGLQIRTLRGLEKERRTKDVLMEERRRKY